jgi:hypothetical protein
MNNPLTRHLREANEPYFAHMAFAMRFGLLGLISGAAAIVHAVFPFILVTTSSRAYRRMAVLLENR